MAKESESRSANLRPGAMVEEIVVIGGGGHAKVVVSILQKLDGYRVLGYTDLKDHGPLLGIPYLGDDGGLKAIAVGSKKRNAVLAVGQVGLGLLREKIISKLRALNLAFPPIVSKDSIVNAGAVVADGLVVMDGAVVNVGAKLGQYAIVNTNCTIEHDSVLEDWVHVAPGATVCGGVTIGRHSMIGAGATVIEGIKIAADCIVGAGATVVEDIIDSGVYVGCPARRIK